MKKILLTSLFIIPCTVFIIQHSYGQAPKWLWAKAIGGYWGSDAGQSMTVDASGNVYTSGHFEGGTVDFDPGAGIFNLTNDGNAFIFISKLDPSGNFVWAKAIGGFWSYSIALDASNNIYITGVFNHTADFDPGAGTYNLTSAGWDDIFISKLDSLGNFVWAKRIGGANYDRGSSIAVDPASGDVYITGTFQGTLDFDPGPGTYNLATGGVFISKLDAFGNFVWAKRIGGGSFYDRGQSIALDVFSNVYTAGTFYQGTADFDPGPGVFNLTSVGISSTFISKLNSSGNFVWAKQFEGASLNCLGIDHASGDIYTTGGFNGMVDFDPGVGVFNLTAIRDGSFISKLNSSGNFVWAKAIDGISYSLAITVDPASRNVYTTGSFGGTVDFDPGPGIFNLFSDWFRCGDNIFISRLDKSGNFIWAKSLGGKLGATSCDDILSIAPDASGNLYVTGSFFSSFISFGATILTNTDNGGINADIFIAKLDKTIVTGTPGNNNCFQEINIFPNPTSNSTTISCSLSQSARVSIQVFDATGRLISILADDQFQQGNNKIVWNVARVSAGIYFLRFITANCSVNEKLIVVK